MDLRRSERNPLGHAMMSIHDWVGFAMGIWIVAGFLYFMCKDMPKDAFVDYEEDATGEQSECAQLLAMIQQENPGLVAWAKDQVKKFHVNS